MLKPYNGPQILDVIKHPVSRHAEFLRHLINRIVRIQKRRLQNPRSATYETGFFYHSVDSSLSRGPSRSPQGSFFRSFYRSFYRSFRRSPTTQDDAEVGFLDKLRRRKIPLAAIVNHIARTSACLFDVSFEVHRLRQELVRRKRRMRSEEILDRPAARQRSGIPDFKPVAEKHDLYAFVTRVVPMANGIDNEFKYRVQRKFVTSRSGTIGPLWRPISREICDITKSLA